MGLVLGTGLVLMARGMPWGRAPSLAERIAPYLPEDVGGVRARRLPAERSWLSHLARRAARGLDQMLGGSASVRRRMLRAGLVPDVDTFRMQQVLWTLGGGVLAGALLPLMWLSRGLAVAPALLLVATFAATGAAARDYLLTVSANRRERQMMQEFPVLAEMLALAVTAGEGLLPAVDRVTRVSNGPMAEELRACLVDARAGVSVADALHALADRTSVGSITRFVDGLVVAVERGTPLADVLRAQAADAREAGRQAVIESGGRREIAMMVPVVFLVLPVTVVFAVFPGLSMLRVGQ